LFSKFLIALFIFISFSSQLYAKKKQLIINQLMTIDNITFNFEQITNKKIESGNCILVFNNKLKCNYQDAYHKEIIINGKRLNINQKRYNKNYSYPIANSPFMKILNKISLIDLVQKSNYKLTNNIELIYKDERGEITILFDKKNYNLIGWKVVDQLQNEINFSLKNISINTKFDPKIFKFPSNN